jgi:hypothetical protein
MDSRLRGNDRHLDRFVIPAKAGIQALLPGLIEKLQNGLKNQGEAIKTGNADF